MKHSGAIGKMARVATIATLASRLETFRKVLPVIHAQVDHVYVYLDGYNIPTGVSRAFRPRHHTSS